MRFSQIYLERGEPTRDSDRLRNRLAAFCERLIAAERGGYLAHDIGSAIEIHLGADIQRRYHGYDIPEFLRTAPLRDLLDAVTVIFDKLPRHRTGAWHKFVGEAFHEENVGYRVDDQCVVHYHVDQEFERNRAATIAVLGEANLVGAAAAHDDAYRHLDGDPQDTKAAVRSIFECLEILTKQIVPTAKNLNGWQCEKGDLRSACCGTITEPTERKVTEGMFDSLARWVDAVHNYRHGQPGEEAVAPTEELAVYLLSTGSANARFLAQFATWVRQA